MIRTPLAVLMTRQFVLFVLAGSVAAFLHWGSRILLNHFMEFRLALVAAYVIGIAAAFLLNKWFVFPDSGQGLSVEFRYFVFFNVAAFPLVWGASVLLAEYAMPAVRFVWHPREVAHAIAIALPLVVNFFLHKFITFKPGRSYANDG
jgi:putative flippase GtrA